MLDDLDDVSVRVGGWVVVEWPWQSVVCLDVVDEEDGDGIPRSQVGVEKGTNGSTENKGRWSR